MKEQIKKILEKRKMTGKEITIVLVLIGIIFAVLSAPTRESSEEETEPVLTAENTETSREIYEGQLEERLENILSQMDGVGRVEVMITMESSTKEVIEKDFTAEQNYAESNENLQGDSSVKKEETTVYADTEEGSIPYVVQEIYPQVEGVLVVAEGGDDSCVNLAITDAIQALFGIDVHKIKIVKMNTN